MSKHVISDILKHFIIKNIRNEDTIKLSDINFFLYKVVPDQLFKNLFIDFFI